MWHRGVRYMWEMEDICCATGEMADICCGEDGEMEDICCISPGPNVWYMLHLARGAIYMLHKMQKKGAKPLFRAYFCLLFAFASSLSLAFACFSSYS